MSKNKEIAEKIKAMAVELGWSYKVHDGILTITKLFTPGSNDEFYQADGEYYSILELLPQSSPGSIWGTDGGGMGAPGAKRDGVFTMNKSGGNKFVLKALGNYHD